MIIDCTSPTNNSQPIIWSLVLHDYLTEFDNRYYGVSFFTWLEETHKIKVAYRMNGFFIDRIELDDELYLMLVLKYGAPNDN